MDDVDNGADPGVSVEDMPVDDRRQLAYDHPALNAYADQVSSDIGIPGIVTALKNAGEKSGSTSVSPKGAQGVMQFIPATAKRYGLTDPTDPVASIQAAGKYVADISNKLGTKDPALIAAAYNAGENRKDIQAGKIPLIPETQNYVKRVRNYLSGGSQLGIDPADNPDLAGGAIDPSDMPTSGAPLTTQADVARAYASPTGPQVNGNQARKVYIPFYGNIDYHVGPDMGNFLAGIDKGVSDPVIGASQRLRELANKGYAALVGTDKGPLFNMTPSYRDAQLLDKAYAPTLRTKAGSAGYFGGAGIDTALATLLTGGAGGSTMLGAAGTGALSGYAMPTSSEDDAYKNAATGAALGPLTRIAGNQVSKLANLPAVSPIVNAIRTGYDKVTGAVPSWLNPALRPSVAGTLTPGARDAVTTALKNDVPVFEKQLTKPGTVLAPDQQAAQRSGFDRAISRTVGQNTDDLNAAWANARNDLSSRYNTLLDNKEIPLDFGHLGDIANLIDANNARVPRFAPNSEVQDVLHRAFQATDDAVTNGTPLSGRDYQSALREYHALATRLGRGTATNPSDPYSANIVRQLADSLEGQGKLALTPQELSEYSNLNRMWGNMRQLESVIPKDLEGNINPRQLANRLATQRRDEFLYGNGGDPTLSNLAKFGSTYVDTTAPPKTGLWATTKQLGAKALPFVLGDIGGGLVAGSTMGGGMGPGDLATDALYGTALGIPLGLTWNAMRKGRAGPQLTLGSFQAPRGAVGRVVRGGVSPGALTRLIEAEKDAQD